MDSIAARAPVVLIVDDVQDNREMYAEYLAYKGFGVSTACNGEDAIAAARAQHPDVILLDLRLPGMTGVQILQLLRSEAAFAHVPIAALTAHAFDGERAKSLAAGFDAYLAKPCLPDDLVVAIERLLRGRVQL